MRFSLLVVLVAAFLPPVAAAGQPVHPLPAVTITWSMPDRFGPDADGDGLIDFPNTTAYAHARADGCGPCPAPRFPVRFDGALDRSLPVRDWEWVISGGPEGEILRRHRSDRILEVRLAEGEYRVEVTATLALPWGPPRVRGAVDVVVDDVLVVAVGDSYASGEGNPEVRRFGPGAPALWGDGGDAAATAAHAAAHRSSVAWPARVALALEQRDPHTSVTFVSVAASGARIDRGILRPHEAGETAQLDQVAALVGDRTIDLLLVQEGGNSVGFSRVVRALVEADPLFDPVCYHLLVDQAMASVRDGDWSRGVRVAFSLPFSWSCVATGGGVPVLPGLDGLAEAFTRLAAGLERFRIDQVVLVGYPDPTGADADGDRCREIVGDVTPPIRFHEVSSAEGRRGVAEVLRPLNRALADAADAHGWTFVAGVDTAFAAGHGYCAEWPDYGYPGGFDPLPPFAASLIDVPDAWYRNPGRRVAPAARNGDTGSWYRTAAQSAVLQGPAAAYATSGTLHPNEIGHAAIARLVLRAMGD